ncbi:MAG: S8 family serine peptidase, partial [Armatimonadetes bacterium]|nr:S8 family serine peptidase [Armatimonadota bacterium]
MWTRNALIGLLLPLSAVVGALVADGSGRNVLGPKADPAVPGVSVAATSGGDLTRKELGTTSGNASGVGTLEERDEFVPGDEEAEPNYVPGQLIVKYGPGVSFDAQTLVEEKRPFAPLTGSDRLDNLNLWFGVESARALFIERKGLSTAAARAKWERRVADTKARFPERTARGDPDAPIPDLSNVFVLEFTTPGDVIAVAEAYAADPDVDYAEPNYIFTSDVVPNDPFWPTSGSWGQSYDDLWALKQINAEQAWDLSQGAGVIVAVIDSGFDFTHPDRGTMWTNTGEIAGNSIDDDSNGFVDDVDGWDWVNNDNDPDDDYGHGTHVTGIINAAFSNSTGGVGIAPQSTAMVLKTLDASGNGGTADLAAAIDYAVANGADVINMSLSTSPLVGANVATLR